MFPFSFYVFMWPLHGSRSLQNWDASDKIMKKDLFLFWCVCVYVNVTMGSCKDQKGAFDPPELEEWVIVIHSTWVLHTEL